MSTKRPAGQQRKRSRPLPPGSTLYTPGATPARRSVEQRSAAPLVYLHGMPAWLPPVASAALLVIGLAVRGWVGGVALVAMAAFLGWLAVVSWPRLSTGGRAGRVVALACVLGLAAFQASR